ncbi:MAG: peptide chain release factor N(5)-glutamine methyltransferase [Gemmatimonadales bacterium]|nr:MAG: peptide chain release factor N(5)-glutamine methyltransferase [Gemmatimonadales bacterium]
MNCSRPDSRSACRLRRPEPPNLREALQALTRELREGGVESPTVEAERLLSHVLGIDRTHLALEGGTALPVEVGKRLAGLVQRRLVGEPLQHLEGSVAFRTLELVADTRALIPRPETEQLIDLICRLVPRNRSRENSVRSVRVIRRPGADRAAESIPRALDIGTGSGAIALSLASENIAQFVVGIDISPSALEQAAENCQRAGLDARVEFRRSGVDPFSALKAGDRFGLIVSNPPYIRDDELASLPAEVRECDPPEALSGGTDGLDLVRCIAERAPDFIESSGSLFLEIGASQATAARRLFRDVGRWKRVASHPDLAGHDRFIVAEPL